MIKYKVKSIFSCNVIKKLYKQKLLILICVLYYFRSGDEVQRSLELLDSVLSEFEEVDRVSVGGNVGGEVQAGGGGAVGGATTASVTPDDDSPSLGGHQSEDDGYMSMNGRR